MKIWILNHHVITPNQPGITRHFDFAKGLIKLGHRIKIIASSFSHRTKTDEHLDSSQKCRAENINGIDFIWVKTFPYKSNNWRRVLGMLIYTIRAAIVGFALKEKPNVILASSPHPFAGLAAYMLSKIKKAKFVFEVRDLWPQSFVDLDGYNTKSPAVLLLKLLEWFLYSKSSRIITLLPKAADYITSMGISASKVVYIPNGVNPDLLNSNKTNIPKELHKTVTDLKSRGKFIVGYTGAHGVSDALDTIISAAKLLEEREMNDIHFLFVGDGPDKIRLINKVKDLGLKNVSFHPSIAKNSMYSLLKEIDVAINSLIKTDLYKYGISPNKIFDYMANARPVVFANNSINNPVADSGCGASIPPEDPQAMAEALIKLNGLSDKQRHDIGLRGYEYVMKYHSLPILADKLSTMLTGL